MLRRGRGVTQSSSSKLDGVGFFYIILVIELNYITESAIYCQGGPQKVDHNVVVGLLRDILDLLVTLLAELKGGDYKGCDISVLGGLVAGLLIVRIFIDPFWLTTFDVSLLDHCRNPRPRYRCCWYR